MGAASATQAGLGVRGGEIHDWPHLVVLSFLDPGLFAAGAWFTSDANRSAHPRDLCHIRSRERCWRGALIEFDTAGGFLLRRREKGGGFLFASPPPPFPPFSPLPVCVPPPPPCCFPRPASQPLSPSFG